MQEKDAKERADRLAEALKRNEARKREAAVKAGQPTPELDRLRELERQTRALPVTEQVALLRDAGMDAEATAIESHEKRRSRAAPVIEPLRGSGPIEQPKAQQPLRWSAWLALPSVELWQGVALSLGINPEVGLRNEVGRGASQYSRLPAEFFERLALSQQAVRVNGPMKPQAPLYSGMLQDWRCRVLLAEVAAFLALADFSLPEQLRDQLPTERVPDRGPLLKREALVAKHERAWPTIDRDLKDASQNGLSGAAKSDEHGMWWESQALAWATKKGKMRDSSPEQPASPFPRAGG